MRVIEITGSPGSGKSTVIAALREYLSAHNVKVCDATDLVLHSGQYPFDRKFWRGLISLLPRPLYAKCLRGVNNYLHLKYESRCHFFLQHLAMIEQLQSLLSSMGVREDHRQRAMRLLLNTGGRYQMAIEAPNPDAVFLLDEGFTHRAVSLFVSHHDASATDSTIIENYVKTAPQCQAVICVEADRATCARRLRGRELPKRLFGASERDVESYIARAGDVIDIATKTLKQSGILVFTVRNTDEPFAKRNITEQLDPFLNAFSYGNSRNDEAKETAVGMNVATTCPALRNS